MSSAALSTRECSRTITCPKCGKNSEKSMYIIVNIKETPEAAHLAQGGNLFRWTCPHCEGQYMIPHNLVYFDEAAETIISFLNEHSSEMTDLMEMIEEKYPTLNLRIVKDIDRMEELTRILDFKLNDKIVEVLKALSVFHIQNKTGRTITRFQFIYYSEGREELDFHCYFQSNPNQEEDFSIPRTTYEAHMKSLKKYVDERCGFERIDVDWAVNVIAKNTDIFDR